MNIITSINNIINMQIESVITNEYEWLIYRLWIKESAVPVQFNFRIPDTIIYK
jgi:hypothetical protein